jgi:hypothetical protein
MTIRGEDAEQFDAIDRATLARGWPIEHDHQADAAWLLDYVATGLAEAA